MKKNDIIVLALALCLILVSVGSVISYQQGYQEGVAFQKGQLTNVSLSAYAGPTLITREYFEMSFNNPLKISTNSTLTQTFDITRFEVSIVPGVSYGS